MKRIHTLAGLLALTLALSTHARDWHVAATGDDANDGKSPQSPLRSLQKVDSLVQPGDVVLVAPGIFASADAADKADGGALLHIRSSGKPGAWITWKALPATSTGQVVELRPTGWAGIQITGSYHIIDGFTLTGANDSLTLTKAQEDAKKPKPDATFNTNGILVEGRRNRPDAKPHHITIRNCVVSKMPGGGITALEADHITIEDNQVFDNAWFMRYAGSGITLLNNWTFDDAPGYHVVIQRNKVWNNKTLVAWERTGKLSDGNGILLDVTDLETGAGATNPNADAVTQSKPDASSELRSVGKRPPWTARALIANNLSAFNGGSGIHTFRTAHVDIVNNTTYWNGGIVGYEELFANRSDDVVIVNNIIVPRPGGRVTSNNRNNNVRWDHNLYPVAQNTVKGDNDIVADPQFVNIQEDLRKADFRLRPGSRGIDSGAALLPQAVDLNSKKRPQGAGRDRGAYEQ
ncbi:MAG: right-handed parallel beta-helix repeat-containing protein [Rhodoferax sp.]|nr:right-handed parallel beta-helix repeat-containing protein [Rhodoferax sp.]